MVDAKCGGHACACVHPSLHGRGAQAVLDDAGRVEAYEINYVTLYAYNGAHNLGGLGLIYAGAGAGGPPLPPPGTACCTARMGPQPALTAHARQAHGLLRLSSREPTDEGGVVPATWLPS